MEKISTVSMVSWLNSWFDRTSMLMIKPYPTPKPNPILLNLILFLALI